MVARAKDLDMNILESDDFYQNTQNTNSNSQRDSGIVLVSVYKVGHTSAPALLLLYCSVSNRWKNAPYHTEVFRR